ncbi:MAG: conjugal transfer protein TraH [Pseudomonadota bacterium]
MIKQIFYKQLYVLALAAYANTASAAGLNTQMDNIFNEMSNYTAPGRYETESRGVYSGGHYVMKSKIFNENLVNFQAPSASGGCGGIDVFGGSFSFVNSDQIVQLMRAVASNAQGYAFQLAMDNMCPDCMKWMNELQAKIQQLNDALSNSCQLAQGLVNSTGTAMGMSNQHMTDITLSSIASGVGEDFADLSEHISSSDTAVTQLNAADPAAIESETGALTYIALYKSNIGTSVPGGDDELIESIMSLTGTIVIGDVAAAPDGGGSLPTHDLPGGKISIRDLVVGKAGAEIYDCSLSDAAEPNLCRITIGDVKAIDITGMSTRILQAFNDPGGILDRLRVGDYSSQPTDAQKNVMAALPSSIGSKLFTLGPISPDAASDFLSQTVNAISLDIVKKLVDESFRVAFSAISADKDTYKEKSIELLIEQQKALHKEYGALVNEYGSVRMIETYYNSILKGVNKPLYRVIN